jgi:hypothetical protein
MPRSKISRLSTPAYEDVRLATTSRFDRYRHGKFGNFRTIRWHQDSRNPAIAKGQAVQRPFETSSFEARLEGSFGDNDPAKITDIFVDGDQRQTACFN